MQTININCADYQVIKEFHSEVYGPMYAVKRPKGKKVYAAYRVKDSQVYGSNRGHIVPGMPVPE